MFVGGEFYEDSAWVTATPAPPIANAVFLNGGRACLSVISRYLRANNIKRILLPSYLCPSILDVLDQYLINYTFYQINEDFSIDLDDLKARAIDYQVIYFINYFGFRQKQEIVDVFCALQAEGKLLIEDNAQAGFRSNNLGDICFNSMRKVCGFDGGYMATRNIDVTPFIDHNYRLNNRLPIIRRYRRQLRSYLFEGNGDREALDELFYQAEYNYEKDGVILGDAEEQRNVERLDWPAIKAVRRSNYSYLLGQILDMPGIIPVFPALQDEIMPMGMPVYVKGILRDHLLELLAEESISLTVHWDALLTDPRTQSTPKVHSMAERILTLPVDQYTSKNQLDYLVDHLARILSTHATNQLL